MNLKYKVMHDAAMQAFNYIGKDPADNLPKLIEALCKLDKSGNITEQANGMLGQLKNPENGGGKLLRTIWDDVSYDQLKKIYETVVVNATFIGSDIRREYAEKYKCNIPWAILMDPTSACNLHCTGCWAAEYGHKLNLTLDELEDIIRQGEEFGCHMYLYSGGEPLVRKDDLITLCRRHPECAFLAFTNSTLIDEKFAAEMEEVKNLVVAISVEGFEADTDFRRGKGTFKAVMNAMEILRRHKLLFGISCCYTSKNAEFIGSEEYFDAMIKWGAKFCWFFTYMPIGRDAVPSLMATSEQRRYMYYQVRKFRETKPLMTIDFWNDGDYVGGCIAGGRQYIHINANGDIEPCGFIHYADSNIRTDKLLDAFQKPLFMLYHENQPFNHNMFRPCPVLDNPGRLTQIVRKSGARSTDMMAPEDPKDYSDRCVPAAAQWAKVSKELWEDRCAHCKLAADYDAAACRKAAERAAAAQKANLAANGITPEGKQ
jgi:MoaA/NifB/PqqE/SkfB family radical SAM enzyme